MTEFKVDSLFVKVYPNRLLMGQEAAHDVAEQIIELSKVKSELNIIFAAAPSQNEFLKTLITIPYIEWNKINAYHMDEYIGLDSAAPQAFGNFLRKHIFDKVPFKNIYYINGSTTNKEEECLRYAKLLSDISIDIVCLGIGENGHIAFNDPHVADFNDPYKVKIVDLDTKCRMQQVNDGCFESINMVPKHAYTITLPTIMLADHLFCIVPGKTKEIAVRDTIYSPIKETCPATILRKHRNSYLYLDKDSAASLNLKELSLP